VVDKLAEYAPNVKKSLIARHGKAQLNWRTSRALKGNYYHIDMTLDQMVFFRPCQNWPTTNPIEGLFHRAGTHPGGSISGMPGRNCARIFLHTQQPIAQKLKEAGTLLNQL